MKAPAHIRSHRPGTHRGIVFVRVPHTWKVIQIKELFEAFLSDLPGELLIGSLTILEPGRYRIRRAKA